MKNAKNLIDHSTMYDEHVRATRDELKDGAEDELNVACVMASPLCDKANSVEYVGADWRVTISDVQA